MKALIMALMVIIGIYAVLAFGGLQNKLENRHNQIDKMVITALK